MSRQNPSWTHSSFVVHGLINHLLSKDLTVNKLRRLFDFWIIPCVNPDGVVIGNGVANTQGIDPSQSFFSYEDVEEGGKTECHEVVKIQDYLDKNLPKDPIHFKMFLDVHDSESQTSIYTSVEGDQDETLTSHIENFNEILDEISAYFCQDNCKIIDSNVSATYSNTAN